MNESDLKFFTWNVRGLNSAARREELKLLIQAVQVNNYLSPGNEVASCGLLSCYGILGS